MTRPDESRDVLSSDARAFMDAMLRRYACKLFDGKPLPREIEDYILECGRLSPSSFGLEPWRFIAVRSRSLIDEGLFEACFRQEAVRTASLVVAILALRAGFYGPDADFVKERATRFPGGHPVFRADYVGYYEFLEKEGRLEEWARAQTYIACANMMTGAAAAGIDSCAIEGYDERRVLDALGEDGSSWRVGIVVSFGRRAESPREKIRAPFAEIAEYR
jgi:nitroreductase